MPDDAHSTDESLQIAQRWCQTKGEGWSLGVRLGQGGTAPVFEVTSPEGPRALKIYNSDFSSGKRGRIELKRIEKQLALKGHDCPYLVQIYDGGRFEDRLFLVMGRAPGQELEKRLADVPRTKIRQILDQVAQAAIFLRSKGLCHRDIKSANVFISDDFDHCTLLDISVIRDLADPIGSGTDQEGQLPFVATARYSPPEYLFRLMDPGPDLWHALTVYQLGGLLHDLIMREPIFQTEYTKSASNRYRFAWIIATAEPVLQADDVDLDLLLIARRALDKNWQRRSILTLEEFLANANTQQSHALQVLGLGVARAPIPETDNVGAKLQRIREVAEALESSVVQYLRDEGVRATHEIHPGINDTSKLISLRWETSAAESSAPTLQIELRVDLRLCTQPGGHHFGLCVMLVMQKNGGCEEAKMELPEVPDAPGVEERISVDVKNAVMQLATQINRARNAIHVEA